MLEEEGQGDERHHHQEGVAHVLWCDVVAEQKRSSQEWRKRIRVCCCGTMVRWRPPPLTSCTPSVRGPSSARLPCPPARPVFHGRLPRCQLPPASNLPLASCPPAVPPCRLLLTLEGVLKYSEPSPALGTVVIPLRKAWGGGEGGGGGQAKRGQERPGEANRGQERSGEAKRTACQIPESGSGYGAGIAAMRHAYARRFRVSRDLSPNQPPQPTNRLQPTNRRVPGTRGPGSCRPRPRESYSGRPPWEAPPAGERVRVRGLRGVSSGNSWGRGYRCV